MRAGDAAGDGCLAAYGWTPAVGERLEPEASGDTPARVVRTDRGAVLAATPQGVRHVAVPPGFAPAPVTGDWVLARGEPPTLARVVPRLTWLARRDGARTQMLAANIDDALLLSPLDRPLPAWRLDRALVLALDGGAEPLVVLTKADLVADPEAAAADVEALVPGTRVLAVAARDGAGLEPLRRRLLPGRTLALLGMSGAGKSTLVNALAGSDTQATGEVRHRDRTGRHTTRARHLVPAGDGAVLLDTPGLRSLGVTGLAVGLARAFPDVVDAAGSCRFTDCRHEREPGCGVLAAQEDGRLDPDRVERYRALLAEAEEPPRGDRRQGRRTSTR